jgi:hypothetical protein
MTTDHEAVGSVPFALGVFEAEDGEGFTGLVRGERVRDVSALGGVNELLADWDASFAALQKLATDEDSGPGTSSPP